MVVRTEFSEEETHKSDDPHQNESSMQKKHLTPKTADAVAEAVKT